MKKYVIYRRVSTKAQGKSGLGLEAQDRDIDLYLSNYSDQPYEALGTFTDVPSVSSAHRPELDKAIALAKREGAELLVAKLDCLSRKVSRISALIDDKKLTIRVAAMPNADSFQLHIYAALSEQERNFISLRTKASLQAAKERGVQLGGIRPGHEKSIQSMKDAADAASQRIASIIIPMRDEGLTLQQIADALNTSGQETPRGGRWYATSVKNMLDRLTFKELVKDLCETASTSAANDH